MNKPPHSSQPPAKNPDALAALAAQLTQHAGNHAETAAALLAAQLASQNTKA